MKGNNTHNTLLGKFTLSSLYVESKLEVSIMGIMGIIL